MRGAPMISGAPWFTVELDGVMLHVPMEDGKTFTLPMTTEGAYALLGELAAKLELLKLPDVQKKIGEKAVGLLVDWVFEKKKGKR